MKIWITRKTFHRKFMSSVNVLKRPSREYHDLSEVYKRFLGAVEDDLSTNYDYTLSDDSKDNMILRFCYGSKSLTFRQVKKMFWGPLVTSRINARDER